MSEGKGRRRVKAGDYAALSYAVSRTLNSWHL